MVKIGEIEQLGDEAQTLAIKLKVEGLSHPAIAIKLNEKYGSNVNAQQVSSFMTRNKHKTFKILKDDKNLQFKMAKKYFNSLDQINELNSAMWKFFLDMRSDPEFVQKQVFCPECNHRFHVQMKTYQTFLKTADHLLKEIEHVDKVLGKMDKGLTINYNYVDLSKKIMTIMPKLCHDLERQNIIKIKNKKRLREQR